MHGWAQPLVNIGVHGGSQQLTSSRTKGFNIFKGLERRQNLEENVCVLAKPLKVYYLFFYGKSMLDPVGLTQSFFRLTRLFVC